MILKVICVFISEHADRHTNSLLQLKANRRYGHCQVKSTRCCRCRCQNTLVSASF